MGFNAWGAPGFPRKRASVPSPYQQRVLMVGVLVALVLRAACIAAGAAIISTFAGVKLALHALHKSGVHVREISIPFSLGFIVLVLAVTTFTSLRASKKQQAEPEPVP
jgi:predicted tellurium resistance membrane protein TerC